SGSGHVSACPKLGAVCGHSRYSERSSRRQHAAWHRSARLRIRPCARRCRSRLLRGAVELRREESRGRLQDWIGSSQFPVLFLEVFDSLGFSGGGAGPVVGIDLVLVDPRPQCFWVHAELVTDAAEDAAAGTRVGFESVADHADCSFTKLEGILLLGHDREVLHDVLRQDIQSSEIGCPRCGEVQCPRCCEVTHRIVTQVLPNTASLHFEGSPAEMDPCSSPSSVAAVEVVCSAQNSPLDEHYEWPPVGILVGHHWAIALSARGQFPWPLTLVVARPSGIRPESISPTPSASWPTPNRHGDRHHSARLAQTACTRSW